ncbi:putative ribonuclease H-like domain-containing protein [Tanacetum coccineum]
MGFLGISMVLRVPLLYGEIEERSVCHQPKGFEDPYYPKLCTEWLKNLYGLHQALEPGMLRFVCFFCYNTIKKSAPPSYHLTIDNALIHQERFQEFEVLMQGEFEISAMGEMNFFLGLQVKQLPNGIFISQDRYVKDKLTKFDMESVRTATTPYEAAKTKLKDEISDPPVNVHLYRSMIDSLMYLTASRPDIMFAVSACSRHQVTPLTSHLNALEAYSDSDYAGSHGDRKSTTGGCQFLGRRLISWQCKKQTIVATSSTKAEYVAAASCCAQVLKIHTDDNVADLLTKAFDGPRFEYLVVHIGMVNPSFVNRGEYCCELYILPTVRLVSASSTMILLVVILPAGCFVSAGSNLFLLSQLSFCCAQFDIAGWLVSATSHLVSAGSLQSCRCNNVSAA